MLWYWGIHELIVSIFLFCIFSIFRLTMHIYCVFLFCIFEHISCIFGTAYCGMFCAYNSIFTLMHI